MPSTSEQAKASEEGSKLVQNPLFADADAKKNEDMKPDSSTPDEPKKERAEVEADKEKEKEREKSAEKDKER